MEKIFITGISGTGKTTIAKELQKRGYRAISLDEQPGLCRWQNKATGKIVDYKATLDREFITAHEWICDVETLKKLIDDDEKPVFVLGMAGNQKELLPFFGKIFLLACAPEIFIKRIMQRENNDFGKEPSAQQHILETYKDFEKEMIGAGAIEINTERNIPEIIQDILNQAQ